LHCWFNISQLEKLERSDLVGIPLPPPPSLVLAAPPASPDTEVKLDCPNLPTRPTVRLAELMVVELTGSANKDIFKYHLKRLKMYNNSFIKLTHTTPFSWTNLQLTFFSSWQF